MSVRQLGLWRVGGFLAALLAAAPAYAVCGDGVWEEDEPCDDGNDVANDACNQCRLSCERVAVPLTLHTCGHGANGPFVSVAAQSYPGHIYSDISPSHTYFTLTLSGEPGQNRSAVLYAAGANGPHPFYMKEQYPLSVVSSVGDEVHVLFEHEVSCGPGRSDLTWVKVYELVRNETYTIVFGPTDGKTASVAIELMPPPIPAFWDRDGDTHGGALAGIGGCEYDAPTVATAGDCDDDDANTHPGAPEVCDGADNDCSRNDDAGAEGLCDDDDAGAACVDAGTAIRCGCAIDVDCEGEATCNAAVQRCEVPSGAGGASGASAGEGGGDAGEAAAAGAPSDAGWGGRSVGGSSDSGGPGTGGEPSASRRGDKRASDGGCSYSSRRGPSSAGLGLLAAVALGLLRRRRSA